MDNNLKCQATKCVYNMNRLCSAKEIEVQGEDTMGGRFTFCGTFEERGVGNMVSEMGNMNLRAEIKQLFSDEQEMDPMVGCNARNCIYNQDAHCLAEHVNIVSEIAETAVQTECQTFYPR